MSNLFSFVTSAGLKPAISGTGILHSIQLNYEAVTLFDYCLFIRSYVVVISTTSHCWRSLSACHT